MQGFCGDAGGGEAANLALALALARRADAVDGYEAVHVYRPTGRYVVFGRRDTHLPGFAAAVLAVRRAGFEPLVRAVGGRAVAYTEDAVVVHHVQHEVEPAKCLDARFVQYGRLLVDALRGLGVPADLGAVAGEYCPGAHSINARGEVKLVGTAQRILRQAWLFASLVLVADESVIRPVLTEVYRHLGQEFDPQSLGCLSSENPTLDTPRVLRALLEAYAPGEVGPVTGAPDLLAQAADLVVAHQVT